MKHVRLNSIAKLLSLPITVSLVLLSFIPSIKSNEIQLRNNTNAFELWKYTEGNEIKIGITSSLVQSFIMVFISEIADKTFVIILIFSAKNEKFKVFVSSFLAVLLMNFISIALGFSVDMLLYKNMIDWVVFLSLLFYGLSLISEARESVGEDRYVAVIRDELSKKKKKELKKYMKESSAVNEEGRLYTAAEDVEMTTTGNRDTLNDPLLTDAAEIQLKGLKTEYDEEINQEEERKYFWFFFSAIMAAECGDRSQISTIAISAIFNIYGVIIGSTLALLLSVFLNVYFGKKLAKKMKEKQINYLCGTVFTIYALEIMLIKFALYF